MSQEEVKEEMEVPTEESKEAVVDDEAAEQKRNPMVDYVLNIFNHEHVEEFLDTLDDEKKEFLSVFVVGFESCLMKNIVGVYDTNYMKSMNLTNELLDMLGLNIRSFTRKQDGLDFTIVWTRP